MKKLILLSLLLCACGPPEDATGPDAGADEYGTDEGSHHRASYLGAGAADVGTTSVTPTYPDGITFPTDVLLLVVANKYPSSTPVTPSGWTRIVNHTGGAPSTPGPDSGLVRLTIYRRDGRTSMGKDGDPLPISIPGANSSAARIYLFQDSSLFGTTSLDVAVGADNAAGQFFLADATSNLYVPGPVLTSAPLITVAALNDDTSGWTSVNLVSSGMTFAGFTALPGIASPEGDDLRIMILEWNVADGGDSPPRWTMTNPAGSNGPVAFLSIDI